MRKSIAFGILTMTLAASAGNLLKNSTFGEDAPQYGAMPPKWQAENLSVWETIDDDGIVIDNGCNCLRYKGKGNEGVPVAWQEFQSEKGVTTYVAAADLKACGCSPSVLVKDSDGNVLATLKPSMSNVEASTGSPDSAVLIMSEFLLAGLARIRRNSLARRNSCLRDRTSPLARNTPSSHARITRIARILMTLSN